MSINPANPVLTFASAETPLGQQSRSPEDVLRSARIAHSSRMATLAHVNRVVDERSTSRERRKSLVRLQYDRPSPKLSVFDEHALAYGEAFAAFDGPAGAAEGPAAVAVVRSAHSQTDTSQPLPDTALPAADVPPRLSDVSRCSSRCSASAATEGAQGAQAIFSNGRISCCNGPAMDVVDAEDGQPAAQQDAAATATGATGGGAVGRRSCKSGFGSGVDRSGEGAAPCKSVAFADVTAWEDDPSPFAKSWEPESSTASLCFDIPTNVSEAWAEAAEATNPGSALASLLASNNNNAPWRRSQRFSAPSGAILPSLRPTTPGQGADGYKGSGVGAGRYPGSVHSSGLVPPTPSQLQFRKSSWVGEPTLPTAAFGGKPPQPPSAATSGKFTGPSSSGLAGGCQPPGTPPRGHDREQLFTTVAPPNALLPSIAAPPPSGPASYGVASSPQVVALNASEPMTVPYGSTPGVAGYATSAAWRASVSSPRDRERDHGRSPGTPLTGGSGPSGLSLSGSFAAGVSSSWSPSLNMRTGAAAASGARAGGVMEEPFTGTTARMSMAVGGSRYRSPASTTATSASGLSRSGPLLRPSSRGGGVLHGTQPGMAPGAPLGGGSGAPMPGALQSKPPLPPPPSLHSQQQQQPPTPPLKQQPQHLQQARAQGMAPEQAGMEPSDQFGAVPEAALGPAVSRRPMDCGRSLDFGHRSQPGGGSRPGNARPESATQSLSAGGALPSTGALPPYVRPHSPPVMESADTSESASVVCAGSALSSLLYTMGTGCPARSHTPAAKRRHRSDSSGQQQPTGSTATNALWDNAMVALSKGRSQKGLLAPLQQQGIPRPKY